jgi:hypothetical protein
MKEKIRPLEAYVGGKWRIITGGREETPLPAGGSLPAYFETEDGVQFSPENLKVEIREAKGKKAILYQAKKP